MNPARANTIHAVTSSLSLVLLRGQLQHLQTAGFEPAVLSSPGQFVEETRQQESVPVFTVWMEREFSPVADLLSLTRIWRLLRRIRPSICNAGTPKAGLLVTVAAWLARVPVRIYTMRGLRLETARGFSRFVLYLTERVTCACAYRVICVSPSLRDRAVALNLVSGEKAIVLGRGGSNGVDVSKFVPTSERSERAAEIRRSLNLRGKPVIGYVGRFTADKGIGDLVVAFDLLRQRFSDACLLLIGSYEKGNPIDSQVRTRIQAGRGIVAIPFQHDIAAHYLVMDVFVLPTHREGFPNTVLEAQAAERPVITTTATGAVDSIVDGKTGMLIPVGDARILAAAIGTLLENPAAARQMGREGRRRVELEFRQEAVWTELCDLYRGLLRERGLPVPITRVPEGRLCLKKQ